MIKAVGNDKSLEQLEILVGERIKGDLPFNSTQELQSMLITNKNVINKTLGYLNLQGTFNCTVTRVRRSGIDLPPEPDLTLKFGDKLMIAGEKEDLKNLDKFSVTMRKNFQIPTFPDCRRYRTGRTIRETESVVLRFILVLSGTDRGILMVALVLSAIGKTGPDRMVHVRFSQPVTASVRVVVIPGGSRDISRR